MYLSMKATSVVLLGMFCCSAAPAQSADTPWFSRSLCIKVKDGKWREYEAYLRDVSVKYAQVRVNSGAIAGFSVAQAVYPEGAAAQCDYHLVTSYIGFPPEAPSTDQVAADMKKAGITLPLEAIVAKRGELGTLVGANLWRWHERVGPAPQKGSYSRLNFYKVKPGMAAEWARAESTGWKQLAEEAARTMPGTAWRAATLAMPGGTDLPYNALTVDQFPSWEAMGKGIPARATWNKVHPSTDLSAYLTRLSEFTERPRVDVVRIVEAITK